LLWRVQVLKNDLEPDVVGVSFSSDGAFSASFRYNCSSHLPCVLLAFVFFSNVSYSTVASRRGAGKYLVSVCSDPHCTVMVWDWVNGEQLAIMRGSSERVCACVLLLHVISLALLAASCDNVYRTLWLFD
jgi:hypothetical protein